MHAPNAPAEIEILARIRSHADLSQYLFPDPETHTPGSAALSRACFIKRDGLDASPSRVPLQPAAIGDDPAPSFRRDDSER
jgi:hypothetical protein